MRITWNPELLMLSLSKHEERADRPPNPHASSLARN